MSGYLEICHCGHDKSTHFEGKHACLGMFCSDDCKAYLNRDTPKPPKPAPPPPTPHVDDGWDDPADVSPVTHPTGCACLTCYLGRMYP